MPPLIPTSRSSRRSEDSQPRTDASNTFSDTVKLEVVRLSGANCWSCLNSDPEFAHVVAQKDGQALYWIQAGLLPFSFKAAVNCITLCFSCHASFDRSSDPCWIFLPTDLNFFIRFEINDQFRCAQNDQTSGRIVPTIEKYRDHLASKEVAAPDAPGGLYRGYYLKNFLHGGYMSVESLQFLTTPKPWHGHPLAAIRRGIAILGSARCYALDRTTIDELTTLRRLYFDDKNLIDKKLVQLYHLSPPNRKRQMSDDESEPHDQKKLATNPDNHGTTQGVQNNQIPQDVEIALDTHHVCNLAEASALSAGPHTDVHDSTGWVLGPSATGNDAIDRFALLLQSTDIIKLLT
ncbi:hypothetical protein BDV19DRAFT_365610 [Aspergillus venezuelensis]